MQSEPVGVYCSSQYKAICKKHKTFPKNYEQSFTLLNGHLCPAKDIHPVSSKRLVHLADGDGYQVWKFHVMVQGLKPGQWPRLWVGVAMELDLLVPLDLRMHGDNYDDSTVERGAITLMEHHLSELLAD